ncbi:MAG: gliding motility-associated C-terminal domain-containing protein [Bacteroidetes bacterium]|nr:gliding motility-associated C-terminal domain-containing protein [Bacteroidota bacterium]
MKNLKITLVLFLAIVLNANKLSACHGQNLLNYNVSVGASGVTINANSDPATCGCGPYWLQTEISCSPAFIGTQPSCLTQKLAFWNQAGTSYVSFPYFNSLLNVPNYTQANNWPDNCSLEPFNPNFIPFSGLCPGKVYYIRSREMVMNPPFGNSGTPFPSYGTWTSVQSFTVPGNPAPPGTGGTITLNLSAAPPTIFCGGGVSLNAYWTGSCNPGGCGPGFPTCEANMTITPTYSWSSSNPVTPLGYPMNTSFLTGSVTTLNIPSLTSTTTFSVWLVNIITTSSGTTASYPNSSNTASSVVAGPTTIFSQAMNNNCMSASVPCILIQPGVVTVNVINNLPAANVTVTPNTCLSSPTFTFTDSNGMPGMTYNWNYGDGSPNGVTNLAIHTYGAAGIYTVTFTKSGGASCAPLITTFTVEVYPNPTSNLTVNSPVCIGGIASFTNTQTNASVFAWSGPGSFTSSAQNPVINNMTPALAGVYSCTTTSSNGCAVVASVNPASYQATLNATSNGPVCAGTTLSLSASGAGSYAWSGPGFSSTLQNPVMGSTTATTTGNYYVTATLSGNCLANAVVPVQINTVSVSAYNNGPVCAGNSIGLTATGNGSFSWAGPNGFSSNLQNPLVPGALTGGVYTVTVVSPQGCVATATTLVIVQAPKVLNPKYTSTLCEGGAIYFEALDGSGTFYSWTGPNGYYSPNANTVLQDATPSNSGTYTLTIINSYSCMAQAKVQVTVRPKPNLDIDMSRAVAGCAPLCNVEFIAKTGANIIDYTWSLGNGTTNTTSNPKNLCYNSAGMYSITAVGKDINGCEAKVTKILEVYPVPVADFTYTTGLSWVNSETEFTDHTTGANVSNWHWSFGMGPDVTSSNQNPTYSYQDTGTYNVTFRVKSDKGCENTIVKKVRINDDMGIFVPNAFTPNGDGSNDVFMAVSNNISKFEILIFDRWGTMVFQSSDIKKGWDGYYKGSIAENAVYVYKINYTNKESKTNSLSGNVTLIR